MQVTIGGTVKDIPVELYNQIINYKAPLKFEDVKKDLLEMWTKHKAEYLLNSPGIPGIEFTDNSNGSYMAILPWPCSNTEWTFAVMDTVKEFYDKYKLLCHAHTCYPTHKCGSEYKNHIGIRFAL